jgi:hypothetical protein
MPNTADRADVTAAVKRWHERGLTENQTDDLIGLAATLADLTGRPFSACLGEIEQKVQELMEARLLGRVHDVVNYGQDLGK